MLAEGWFDPDLKDPKENGWLITDWFPGNRFSDGRDARIGTGRKWASDSWSDAFSKWERFGRNTLLYLDPAEEANMWQKAMSCLQPLGMVLGQLPPEPPSKMDPNDLRMEGYRAAKFMFWYRSNRQHTNFLTHFHRAEVEAKPETVQARRTLYAANQARKEGHREQALRLYESDDGMRAWRGILEKYEQFRKDDLIQEDSYEAQLRYERLIEILRSPYAKRVQTVECCLTLGLTPQPLPLGTLYGLPCATRCSRQRW